jgi:hypothetical protein
LHERLVGNHREDGADEETGDDPGGDIGEIVFPRDELEFIGGGALADDPGEAAVKRAMVACANFVVVVADSSKLGREEFVSFAPIDRVDVLVTDSEITPEDRAELTETGVDVVVAQALS